LLQKSTKHKEAITKKTRNTTSHKQSYLDNAVTEGIIISERDKKKTENQS